MLKSFRKSVSRKLLEWRCPPVVVAVRRQGLSYLEPKPLLELHHAVQDIEDQGRSGVLIEAGCALGGSAIVIAAAKSRARPLYVYDVFGMIPAPGEKDDATAHQRYEVIRGGKSEGIEGRKYYGYEQNLLDRVKGNFASNGLPVCENNVHLVKGLFEETLHIEHPVALAHIDGDWYSSVMTCLHQIAPNLVPGGRFVIDDYKQWPSCRKAVDEYFADKRDQFDFVMRSRLHIVRK